MAKEWILNRLKPYGYELLSLGEWIENNRLKLVLVIRGFNNEVQHLGKREGIRYPEDVCTRNIII